MNGKPKSYRAMLLAVATASHPELDAVDKAVLHVIAINAEAPSGKGSRPGNTALMAGTTLHYSALRERLKKNLRLGLIECTFEAHGRGKASVYRLCLDNPAYPDRMPNGEWLLDTPDPDPNNPDNVQYRRKNLRPEPDVSADKNLRPEPDVLPSKTSGHDAGNLRPDTKKPPAIGHKTSGLSRTTSNISTEITTNPPTKTAIAPEKTSGASSKGGGVEGWILKNLPTMGMPKGKYREAINQFVAEQGDDVVTAALNQFLNRADGFGGVKIPWALFISEAGTLIGQVKQEQRDKEGRDLANRRAGEQLKAELLPQFETLDPPLTESERKELDEFIARGEELLTNPSPNAQSSPGIEYYIFWQCQLERLSYFRRSRMQKKVDEDNSEPIPEEIAQYVTWTKKP